MKKLPLMKISMIENFATREFNLSHKNIILDSVKVYGVKKDIILGEINIKIHIHPNDLPVISVSSVEFEKYDTKALNGGSFGRIGNLLNVKELL